MERDPKKSYVYFESTLDKKTNKIGIYAINLVH